MKMKKTHCFKELIECQAAVIDKTCDIMINAGATASLYAAFAKIVMYINVFVLIGLIYGIFKYGLNGPKTIGIFCVIAILESIISYRIRKLMLKDFSDIEKKIAWYLFTMYSKYDELNEEEREIFFEKYIHIKLI